MITPNRLQKNDTVGIVSTARKISKEELKPALQLLESWGLKAVLGKTIGAEENQFAGSDDLRAADFQQMIDDPKIKAIWCAKGGYGTVRIIDKLDFSNFRKNPKWVIGYSDVTALHSHIHTLGIETLHAQILQNLENKSKATSTSIKEILFGGDYEISIASNEKLNTLGAAQGPLVGGNLSLIYSLCGSNSSLNTEGKILFIEDLDEYLYHIDRMMMNLKRNGMLQNLSGLIVGGMTNMHDNAVPFGKTAEEIIFDLVSEYNFPVCFNFPVGHINDNRALILGREVELKVTKNNIALSFKK
ncbi:S66 peptidase family protein [Aequorivita marisscotiae]|uniref:LD-carboxypeptidase n=1 Tax=Aequorivita marisscotiae TaxID=3040348 RepID=A0ABY8L0W9_9FLAO|nr:LD-carboxypeptidase [Aequorivita sp. Ant34-E75]WGF93612.1 LD-carboxypeptidase [Aequorivita sp. Ant34-E75]